MAQGYRTWPCRLLSGFLGADADRETPTYRRREPGWRDLLGEPGAARSQRNPTPALPLSAGKHWRSAVLPVHGREEPELSYAHFIEEETEAFMRPRGGLDAAPGT